MIPIFPEFWTAVSEPDLVVLQQVLSSPAGVAAVWAQVIAFDLFIGRWMYLDSRARGISPWPMSPLLLLTILLSPNRPAGLPCAAGDSGTPKRAPVIVSGSDAAAAAQPVTG